MRQNLSLLMGLIAAYNLSCGASPSQKERWLCDKVREEHHLRVESACDLISQKESETPNFVSANGYVACKTESDKGDFISCCCKESQEAENNDGGILDGGKGYAADANSGGGYDNGSAPSLITDEEAARNIIAFELRRVSYLVGLQDGTWSVILQNPESGNYDLSLEPDLRFQKDETRPYSYFEFDSLEDPGIGVSSEAPFYREIVPDTEERIKRQVRDYLNEL